MAASGTSTPQRGGDGSLSAHTEQPVVTVSNQVAPPLQVYYALCKQHGCEPLGSVCTALAFHVTQLQFEADVTARDLLVLSHILQFNATVTTLDFSRCCIGNHGCYPLASILSSNRACCWVKRWS